jgi:hypothetical protein
MSLEYLGKMPAPVRIMLENILRNMAPNLPEELDLIMGKVLSFDAKLDRLENQNRLIMSHLGISTGEHDDGRIAENDRENRQASGGVASGS